MAAEEFVFELTNINSNEVVQTKTMQDNHAWKKNKKLAEDEALFRWVKKASIGVMQYADLE